MKSVHFYSQIARIFAAAFLLFSAGCATVRTSIRPGYYPLLYPSEDQAKRYTAVRVLLSSDADQAQIVSSAPVTVVDLQKRSAAQQLTLNEDARVLIQNRALILDRRFMATDRIRLIPASGSWIKVNGCRYRGEIEIALQNAQGTLLIVNHVPLEEYLKGVVPNEMQYTWPPEALKAQAVAARTFTLGRMRDLGSAPYDLESGTNSQVYRGLDSERPSTSRAVEETRHIIAVYQGKLISAFYHSNCGGHTADVKQVWGGDLAYLQGTACGFCNRSAHHDWTCEISLTDLSQILVRHNVPAEDIRDIAVRGRNSDGRIQALEIRHRRGTETIKGPAFRMLLGPDRLKSTNFELQVRNGGARFRGKGWGHGVGLCQEGACGMAGAGWRFEQILAYYYPGIELRRLEME